MVRHVTSSEKAVHNIRMKPVACLFLLSATARGAEMFSGTVVDLMCRGKDLKAHTRECAATCAKSGYGLVTGDGKFYKFDEAGNAKTLPALKKMAPEKNLMVKVNGTLAGELLKVESIEFLP